MSATPFDDTLPGTAAAETIDGLAGADSIAGFGGNDLLLGGDGADTLRGAAGAGTLDGGEGDDVIFAGDGAWLILGGNGADTIIGAGGDDTILGGDGDDLLIGNGGADSILGGAGADSIEGRGGSDTLFGGTENDTMAGGSSGDWLAGEDGDDYLLGGWLVEPAAPTALALSAATVAENADGAAIGQLSVTDADPWEAFAFTVDDTRFEVIEGLLKLKSGIALDFETEPSVTVQVTVHDGEGLTLTESFVIAVGDVDETPPGAPAPTLAPVNAAPTDIALGGTTIAENSAVGALVGTLSATDPDAGDSFTFALLDDAGGAFALDGDRLVVAGELDFEAGATRQVRVQVTDSGGLSFERDLTIGLLDLGGATINGTAGADTVDATTTIAGRARPGAEGDLIRGAAGNDLLSGLGGADTLDGGGGDDTLVGGAGDDVFIVGTALDRVEEAAGGGTDTVRAAISWTLGAEVEALVLTGMAGITGTGNGAANLILGNGGANRLAGLGGADTLDGGAGSDTASYAASAAPVAVSLGSGIGRGGDAEGDRLSGIEALIGSVGADSLGGDGGANTLNGGLGGDTLEGGAGTDRFVYDNAAHSRPATADLILDFQAGVDRIDLGGLDANSLVAGDQALGFAGQTAAVVAFSLSWFETAGTTVVQADINGDAIANFRLVLSGTGLGLTAADFVL